MRISGTNLNVINNRFSRHLLVASVMLLAMIVLTIPTSTLVYASELNPAFDFKWVTYSNSTAFKGEDVPFMILTNFATNERWLDESGKGIDGYLHGAKVVYQWIGEGCYAVNFDGVNDSVNCGNDTSLNCREAFSIEVWVRPDQKNYHATVASKENYNNLTGWLLFQMGGTDWYFRFYNGTSSTSISLANSVTIRQFQQIVVTYDGEFLKLFKNGEEIKSSLLPNWLIAIGDENLLIGARSTVANQNFNGSIRDVRIYGRALNISEIKYNYDYESVMNSDQLLLDLTFRNLRWTLERSEDGLHFEEVAQQSLNRPTIVWSENQIGLYYYRAKFTGDLYYTGVQYTDIRVVSIVDQTSSNSLAKAFVVVFSLAAFSLLASTFWIAKRRKILEKQFE